MPKLLLPNSVRDDEGIAVEHHRDACGIYGAIAGGPPTRELFDTALHQGCEDQNHRQGRSPINRVGDGVGVAMSMPRELVLKLLGAGNESEKRSGMGLLFVSRNLDRKKREGYFEAIKRKARVHRLRIAKIEEAPQALGHFPVDVQKDAPIGYHIFFQPEDPNVSPKDYERSCYGFYQEMEVVAKKADFAPDDVRVVSFSPDTLVLKSFGTPKDLESTWPILQDPDLKVSWVTAHQRFSTNTFPSWWLAQPFFMLLHNGEINTISKNRRTGKALERALSSHRRAVSILTRSGSDSADMDRVMQQRYFAFRQYYGAGMALLAALQTTIPPAHNSRFEMMKQRLHQDAREFHQWLEYQRRHLGGGSFFGGPAAVIASTRDTLIGTVDNMALRPLTYAIRTLPNGQKVLVMASEFGALGIGNKEVIDGGLLGPGRFIMGQNNDEELRIWTPEEAREKLVRAMKNLRGGDSSSTVWSFVTEASKQWVYSLDGLSPDTGVPEILEEKLRRKFQAMGGWKREHFLNLFHMAVMGKMRVQSMGTPFPMAALREPLASIFDCAQQCFAQVTNPPIDSIREGDKFDLTTCLGGRSYDTASYLYGPLEQIKLDNPVISNQELAQILEQDQILAAHISCVLDLSLVKTGKDYQHALETLGQEAVKAVQSGTRILVLSHRMKNAQGQCIPIESPIALGAIIKALNGSGYRDKCSIVFEAADVKEAHDVGLLLALGANAINPFVAEDTVADGASYTPDFVQVEDTLGEQAQKVGKKVSPSMRDECTQTVSGAMAVKNLYRGLIDGLKKIMSKMGINDIDGYRGSALFTLEGIGDEVGAWLNGLNPSLFGGQNMEHRLAYLAEQYAVSHGGALLNDGKLPAYADLPHAWRKRNEEGPPIGIQQLIIGALKKLLEDPDIQSLDPFKESFNPSELTKRQTAALANSIAMFAKLRHIIGFGENSALFQPRDLMHLRGLSSAQIDEAGVYPEDFQIACQHILPRMKAGQMSFGAILKWAKESIELAMNALGTFGGSGEGGLPKHMISENARPKSVQVASGRFGVTPEYLANSTVKEICIKIAQGAKPGEGGQLPGYKVSLDIAKNRYCEPGTELISPPPHHDIYSIEELLQLIEDLRAINPKADIAVKLVSGTDIGTIAAGVVKAGADIIEIDGVEGGTGAAPDESLHHAGLRTETAIREVHQVLTRHGLRDLIKIRAMGGIKCAQDSLKYMLLGADEIAGGTLPMIGLGCNLQAKCNLGCGIQIAFPIEMVDKDGNPKGNYAELHEVMKDPEKYKAFVSSRAKQVFLLWYSMGLEMAVMFRLLKNIDPSIERFEDLIGRVDLLEKIPPEKLHGPARTMEIEKLLSITDSEKALLENRKLREENRRGWDRNEVFQDRKEYQFIEQGQWPSDVIVLNNRHDRSFGGGISGERIRAGDENELVLRTAGFAGNSYAVWGSINMHFRHRGFAEAGFAKGIGEGCTVSLLRPANAPLHMPIVANNVGFGATGGSIFVDSITGQRCGIRLSGKAKLFSRGGGEYAAEYMTGGSMVMLPDPRLAGTYEVVNGLFGSGMSGGEAFVFVNRNQDIHEHLPKTTKFIEKADGSIEEREEDGLEVVELSDEETRGRFFALLDHFKELGLSEAEITNWKNNYYCDQGRVVCVRPKGKACEAREGSSEKYLFSSKRR